MNYMLRKMLSDCKNSTSVTSANCSSLLVTGTGSYPRRQGLGPLPHCRLHSWSSSTDCLAGMHSLAGPTLPSQSCCMAQLRGHKFSSLYHPICQVLVQLRCITASYSRRQLDHFSNLIFIYKFHTDISMFWLDSSTGRRNRWSVAVVCNMNCLW